VGVGGAGRSRTQQQGNPGNNGEGKTRALQGVGADRAGGRARRALCCGAVRWLAGKGAGGRAGGVPRGRALLFRERERETGRKRERAGEAAATASWGWALA
jgi:hypothetical protein